MKSQSSRKVDEKENRLMKEHIDTTLNEVLVAIMEASPTTTFLWDDDLFERGLDSLSLVALTVALEDSFRILLPDESLRPEVFRSPRSIWAELEPLLDGDHELVDS